ncbi:MAG: PLP-dependent aminotransferase family protein [Acidimicrobiia bacterium]
MHSPTAPACGAPRLPIPARRSAALQSSEIRDLLHLTEAPGVLSLAGGLPAPEGLAVERIRAAADRALSVTGRYGPPALQYGPTEGLATLRELLAAGTPTAPPLGAADDVIVTTGSQQGLDLVSRVLLDPGDSIAVEDPVYLGARQVFAAHGATLVGIPTDGDGLDTEVLARRLRTGWRPQFVYCVPNFSNPSGVSLSPARRAHLAELAAQFGFAIVEDDPYRALGFSGEPPASIGIAAPDHTVTLGSASKVVAPGLRVGWLRAPRALVRALVTAKQTVDLHTATLPQLVVADLLADDAFLRTHLAETRDRYRTRALTLHHALRGVVDAPVPDGGMFLWGRTGVDTRSAFAAAIDAGVAYVPGDAFAVDADGGHRLRLSFATLTPDELRVAAKRLRVAFGRSAIPG